MTVSNFGAKPSSYSAFATRLSITSGASVPRPIKRLRNSSTEGGLDENGQSTLAVELLDIATAHYVYIEYNILSGSQLLFHLYFQCSVEAS